MTRYTTTSTTRFGATVLLAIASSFLALTPPAFAADDDIIPQARLNVSHVDFTSAKSVAQLRNRVRRTAYTICMPNATDRMPMSTDQAKCYKTALFNGLAQIEGKRLAALRPTSTTMASAQPEEHLTH